MILMKILGGVLAFFVMGIILYLGLMGYQPTPTQVRTDITAALKQK